MGSQKVVDLTHYSLFETISRLNSMYKFSGIKPSNSVNLTHTFMCLYVVC